MNGNKFYESLIESVVNNFNSASPLMFIKHYNHSLIPKDIVENVVRESTYKEGKILYHNYRPDIMQDAYMPLMDWIKKIYFEEYSQYTPEDFVKECNVYPLQRQIFSSFLKDGVCTRQEEIIYAEVEYEKKRFSDSIVRILNFISRDFPIVIVLNDLQYANHSVFFFLNYVLSNSNVSLERCVIISSYNEAVTVDALMQDEWNNLIRKASHDDLIYENIMFEESSREDTMQGFVPNSYEIDDYIVKIGNMIYMLGTEQAKCYLDIINHKIERERFAISENRVWKLYKLQTMSAIHEGDYNAALISSEKMKKNSKYTDALLNVKKQDLSIWQKELLGQGYSYYYTNAIVHSAMMQVSTVQHETEKCCRIADLLDDKIMNLKSRILRSISKYNGWNNIYDIEIKDEEGNEEFLREIYEAGYPNIYAHICSYSHNNDKESLMRFLAGEDLDTLFHKAVEIGIELDNSEFLIVAYMKNVILCSDFGCYNRVEEIYREKISHLIDTASTEDGGNMYNGMGYNYSVTEQYVKAGACFDNALNVFLDDKKAEKAVETLYNMGLNFIAAQEYELAANSLDEAIKILGYLKIHEVVICNEFRLYALIALCDYYLGLNYNCYSYLSRIEFIARTIIKRDDRKALSAWDQTLFYYYIVEGLLYESDNEYEDALRSFDNAKLCIDRAKVLGFIAAPLLAEEKSSLLRKMGREDEAIRILENAVKECTENGFRMKAGKLASLIDNPGSKSYKSNLKMSENVIEDIDKMARVEAMKKELERKNKQMGFLTMWQDSLRQETKSANVVIENSMITIMNVYGFEDAIYIGNENNKPSLIYSNKCKISSQQIERICRYFEKKPLPIVVHRNDNRYFDYTVLLDVFGIDMIESIIGIPMVDGTNVIGVFVMYSMMGEDYIISKELPDEDALTVIKWACNQLYDAVERIKTHTKLEKMNLQLQEISITDNLTGLLNRQGLAQRIEKGAREISDITELDISNYMMYFDLDNFKYYNDQFGHAIGDCILVAFAKILKEVSKNEGFAVRYGGDEFIVILPYTTLESAGAKAKKVHELIAKRLNADAISKMYGREVTIEPGKELSCSIGIAGFSRYCDEDVNVAMKNSDTALYEIKHTTKNATGYWTGNGSKTFLCE